jgi:hypothetical protein
MYKKNNTSISSSQSVSDGDGLDVVRIIDDDEVSHSRGSGQSIQSRQSMQSRQSRQSRHHRHHKQSKQSKQSISDSDSSYSSITNISSIPEKRKSLSQEDILNMKTELLYQFERLEKKGIKLPKKFTIASSLDEMKQEYERMKKDREVDISIRFQRKILMTVITGLEFANSKYDPFEICLDGWSEHVNDGLGDFDDIFEEFHEKYKGKANMPPELQLMFALGGSAFMFHLRSKLFKSGMSDMMPADEPQPKQRAHQSTGGGGGMLSGLFGGLMSGGGIGSVIGSMMGGGGGNPFSQQQQQPIHHASQQMRGPTNVEDILKEMNINDGNRVETMSTMSESDITEIPDDASTGGEYFSSKKKKTIIRKTLDI